MGCLTFPDFAPVKDDDVEQPTILLHHFLIRWLTSL
jgi:hypothetical protein